MLINRWRFSLEILLVLCGCVDPSVNHLLPPFSRGVLVHFFLYFEINFDSA